MKTLLTIVFVLMAATAHAQPVPANLGGTGCPATITEADAATYAVTGSVCKFTDASSITDCDPASGTGTDDVVCWYNGSAWQLISESPLHIEDNRIGSLATLPTCDGTVQDKVYIDTTGPGLCWCDSSTWTLIGGTGPCT